MVLQPILDMVEVLAQQGIANVLLSPGSRSAAITLAFARHPAVKCRVAGDERSAAFIALGIAQASGSPVAMVCTSGTAVLNFAPALAEAFYQRIPLIAITADRPPEWIDQYDGQAIRQAGIYGGLVKRCFEFPADFTHPDSRWHANRIASEAAQLCRQHPQGPVHLNVPVREPFYPVEGEPWHYNKGIRTIVHSHTEPSASELPKELIQLISAHQNILVMAGQSAPIENFSSVLSACAQKKNLAVIADVTANLQGVEGFIRHSDVFLSRTGQCDELKPDLLISTGGPLLSRVLKQFIRKSSPEVHIRLDHDAVVPDTVQNLSHVVHMNPVNFFNALHNLPQFKGNAAYLEKWHRDEKRAVDFIGNFFPQQHFGEFEATYRVLKSLPEGSVLHLANSMPVRYANLLGGLIAAKHIRVASNRGTSGIDGCLSTAVGFALASSALNIVLTGDMAFHYDRNALWSDPIPGNLKIIVLNNHGGGIFRLIDGPSGLPELEEYFETRQMLRAENTCRDFGMCYIHCSSRQELDTALHTFFRNDGRCTVLEIESKGPENQIIYKKFREQIKTEYGT